MKATGLVEKATGSVAKSTGSTNVEKATRCVEKVTAGVSKPNKAKVVVTDVVGKKLKLTVKGPSKALEFVDSVLEKDKPPKVDLTKV